MAKKKRAQPGKFKCGKCDRVFSMAAHLARHSATIHASPSAKAAKTAKKKVGRPAGRGPGRPPGRPAGRSPGRPSGLAARVGLRQMSLEQISELIEAARAEAQVKIAELQQSFA